MPCSSRSTARAGDRPELAARGWPVANISQASLRTMARRSGVYIVTQHPESRATTGFGGPIVTSGPWAATQTALRSIRLCVVSLTPTGLR
ncbi:hypothetical protein EVAR_75710_1 [Eumeta japonica]|uniref:Uncharacterized protein n=1 Tax=Eumeta variegata TaxID=151549 RepID=A0A4C1W193_EUMVA|nr:hypothetical protein EVAR_75710_1 [Eumeta japonica]